MPAKFASMETYLKKPVSGRQFARLTLIVPLLLAMSFVVLRSCEPAVELAVKSISNRHGVTVYYEYDRKAFFPENWLQAPISAKGSQMLADEVTRLVPIIHRFLGVYPARVVKDNLESIYLLERLEIYGKDYGATNGRSSLYVRSEGKENGYGDLFLLGQLHHEFSSILKRNHPFPLSQWKQVNPAAFRYLDDEKAALDWDDPYVQDEKLLRAGFVTRYATSSLENDFNVVAKWLFTRDVELRKLATQYPRIAAKRQLAISFYKTVSSEFSF